VRLLLATRVLLAAWQSHQCWAGSAVLGRPLHNRLPGQCSVLANQHQPRPATR